MKGIPNYECLISTPTCRNGRRFESLALELPVPLCAGDRPQWASRTPSHKAWACPSTIAPLVALCMVILAAGTGWARDEACEAVGACRDRFALESGGFIPIYRSHSLTSPTAIERAVVVIHGNRRDADRYFDALTHAAAAESRSSDTLQIAPQFQTAQDDPAGKQHFWSSSGWKIGNRSRDPARISSFEVLDELFDAICPIRPAAFPKMNTVVLVGHSAGGQFVQRYAAGGAGCPNPAVEVRYVVMNPSSYLYIDHRRRAEPEGPFVPHRFGCWDYDEYKYGLADLNAYMETVGEKRIRDRLFTRAVYYLAGEEDNRRDSSSLDKSCEGNLQGPHRLARFLNYRDYSRLFESWKGSVFRTIPGIGHSGKRMLMSETAREILFR